MCIVAHEHKRLPVFIAGHELENIDKTQGTYFCQQLGLKLGLESTALPQRVIVEEKLEAANVLIWSTDRIKQEICRLKPHFNGMFDYVLSDVDGAKLMRIKDVHDALELGVDLQQRCKWLVEFAEKLRQQQQLYNQQRKLVTCVVSRTPVFDFQLPLNLLPRDDQ